MKKIFALAVCAIMVMAMMVPSMAADDYIVNVDFESELEGPWINVDDTILPIKKSGTIEVAKIGDTMAMRFSHPDTDAKYDCYLDMLSNPPREGDVTKFGAGHQVVIEYDVYFETVSDSLQWMICMSREYPVTGGTFENAGAILGSELQVAYDGKTIIESLEVQKWHHVAVAYDTKNNVLSAYVNGICLYKDHDYRIKDPSAEYANLFRTAFNSFDGEAVAYIDNIKIYNAEQPRGLESAAPVTTAPETTAAPVTEAATQATAAPSAPAAPTADIAVILAAVSAIAACGTVVFRKKH